MAAGYELWRGVLKEAKYVVAPMVDQSELAWRMLSRRYGAELCYTPMLHAAVFARDANYRKENLQSCPEDRPLIVQFCANNPHTLLQAAKLAAPYCDAVDLNLGCPQSIARKGHYGAFLQDEWDLLRDMVGLLHRELSVPITCKIRVFEDVEKTVKYAQMLESAGCQLLTVHGRTREQKGTNMGLASWEHIRAVKQQLKIPVFANGNIQYLEDVHNCFHETSVDGIMSAEGNLYNPAIFTGDHPLCWQMSEEYLELVKHYHCPFSYVRGHIFKIWFHVLKQPEYQHHRESIGAAKTLDQIEDITAQLKASLLGRLTSEELTATDYTPQTIPFWRCQPYFRPRNIRNQLHNVTSSTCKRCAGSIADHTHSCHSIEPYTPYDGSPSDQASKRARSPADTSADSADIISKKKRKALARKEKSDPNRKPKWITCLACKANPKGMKCVHDLCKLCCRARCRAEKLSCPGHRYFTNPKPLNYTPNKEEKERESGKERAGDCAANQDAQHDSNCRTEINRTTSDLAT